MKDFILLFVIPFSSGALTALAGIRLSEPMFFALTIPITLLSVTVASFTN